jgi:hypothetical protein
MGKPRCFTECLWRALGEGKGGRKQPITGSDLGRLTETLLLGGRPTALLAHVLGIAEKLPIDLGVFFVIAVLDQ